MTPNVEANSLSDILELAANPPKYPRNPTEKERQSLTLYIARVPGSKDIILTTLKPQLKNVTAADVASSLYYLHLDTEDDARLLADNQSLRSEEIIPNAEIQKPLPRKPLPEKSKPSLDITPDGPVLSASVGCPSSVCSDGGQFVNNAVLSQDLPADTIRHPISVKVSLPRKPLGPRPLLTESSIGRKPLPGTEIGYSGSSSLAEAIENSATNYASSPSWIDASTQNSFTSSDAADANAQRREVLSKGFSITLIRRDPASGAQWNIGKIIDQSLSQSGHDRETKPKLQPRKAFSTILVHLTTPGYVRFRDYSQVIGHVSGAGAEEPISAAKPPVFVSPSVNKGITQTGFDRQVQMEWSNFWDHPFNQYGRGSSESSVSRGSAAARTRSDYSDVAVPVAAVDKIDSADSTGSRARGYTFASPWGGRCSFSTGGGGRNLRCKHTLPGKLSSTLSFESGSSCLPPVAVSELRFNLPASVMFTSSATSSRGGGNSGLFSIPKIGHIRNKLSSDKAAPALPPRPDHTQSSQFSDEIPPTLPPRPDPTSYAALYPSDEDDGRLDLSIGREKAGGGNRGKRVKLGKLIIHDEGLKMLDLVVAANMGVWWSVWERGQH